jgi:hypothetical protein
MRRWSRPIALCALLPLLWGLSALAGESAKPGKKESAMSEAETLAQRQLDAYNVGDLEAFVACYTPDVEIFDLHSGELRMSGRDAMRDRYGKLFEANPEQKAELLNRIAQGSTVVDHERVVGRADGKVVFAVAIYQVEEGLIRRVWFAR